MPVEGFLNLLKPPGMTSHDAVSKVRRIFGTRSVGHAGTLDPAASGVLPMAIGRATRLLEYMVDDSKTYIGEATFGVATDTLDQCGQVTARQPVALSVAALEQAMAAMVGCQLQSPPAYSAVKHQGKPLYEYARQGEVIEKPGREIEIKEFTLLSQHLGRYPRCLFRVDCSKGTYVRVLVKDLAAGLGTIGTLTFLLRSRVGKLTVQDAYTLEELSLAGGASLSSFLLPLDTAVSHLPSVQLDEEQVLRFINGQTVAVLTDAAGICCAYGAAGLIGVGAVQEGTLKPRKVLTSREDIR